jgi:transposase
LGRAARRRVERLSRKTQDKTTFRRCQIVLKTAQGESRMQIAAALNCDVSTVSRALAAFREHGESGLLRKVSPGRPRKLTDEQVKRLDETVEQEPREMGKNHSNWSSQTLTGYLDLPVHPVTVQRYLKRLGWRWMRVGQQHSVDTPGKNHKTYGFGAVNVVTGWLAWLVWPHKNNVGFRHLLTQVLRLHPADAGKIVVVVDNYRIHKTQAVNQMLTKLKGHLRLYFLPTYSPTLNPIERLWRYFREQVTSNYFFKTMSRLLVAVEGFFAELVASPDVVLNLVSVA